MVCRCPPTRFWVGALVMMMINDQLISCMYVCGRNGRCYWDEYFRSLLTPLMTYGWREDLHSITDVVDWWTTRGWSLPIGVLTTCLDVDIRDGWMEREICISPLNQIITTTIETSSNHRRLFGALMYRFVGIYVDGTKCMVWRQNSPWSEITFEFWNGLI